MTILIQAPTDQQLALIDRLCYEQGWQRDPAEDAPEPQREELDDD